MLFIRDAQRNEKRGVGVSVKRAKVKGTRAVIAVPNLLRNFKLSSFFISFTVEMLSSHPSGSFIWMLLWSPDILQFMCLHRQALKRDSHLKIFRKLSGSSLETSVNYCTS